MNHIYPKTALQDKHGFFRKKRAGLILLAYLSPFLAAVIVFKYIPIFGWILAFIKYQPGVPIFQSEFTGLRYFQRIFVGTDFWKVLRNTLGINLIGIGMSWVPVAFAIMITQVPYKLYARSIQTLTSIPNFISWVLVYAVMFYLIGSESSAINHLFIGLGIIDRPLSVLTNVKAAWVVQVTLGLWKGTGYGAIIYLASIMGIDQELYQAADVDGCSGFQKIIHITVPGVAPTYFVMLLLSISNMLSNGFEQYWLFGNGITWEMLEVFDTYVYRMGIINGDFSFSTALGIFRTIISVILLTGANRMSKYIRGETIF
ncbi:MAG: ABC transporter permease subunit [Treponema sp.]|jgi:ABC-type polysaccharide transport system permease subunit|nr:ABC transporter permease subunit [Treponema sp.]